MDDYDRTVLLVIVAAGVVLTVLVGIVAIFGVN